MPLGSLQAWPAIIMLTDGQRTTGVDPLDARQITAQRGVRKVCNVGIGTVDGDQSASTRLVDAHCGWTRKPQDHRPERPLPSTSTLHQQDLKVYHQSPSSRSTLEKKETEVSSLFLAGAAAWRCWRGSLLRGSGRVL